MNEVTVIRTPADSRERLRLAIRIERLEMTVADLLKHAKHENCSICDQANDVLAKEHRQQKES